MQSFRESFLRWPITAFIAVIFLNMGFFLMEVRALDLDRDPILMENISGMNHTATPR